MNATVNKYLPRDRAVVAARRSTELDGSMSTDVTRAD